MAARHCLKFGNGMSRLGKKAIHIPAGTTVSVSDGVLTVKGKGGELTRTVRPMVSITVEGSEARVEPVANTRLARALWGTYASHLTNMVRGVNEPFKKQLILEGVGYRVAVTGNSLTFNVGFSHPVVMEIPKGITVAVEKNNITIAGADKELLGEFAANVRAIKKPEPYKGKGIRYEGEVIRRKQGKKAAA